MHCASIVKPGGGMGEGEHKLTEAGWGCETDVDLEASTKPFI